MQDALLSDFERINRLLERAATDVYGFLQICGMGEVFRAEQITLDLLNEAMERGDLADADLESLYLREKLLTDAWRVVSKLFQPWHDPNFERFFSLSQATRAALYLRHRVGFSFIVISRILSLSEKEVREHVFSGRERILGRPLRKIEWGF